MKSGILLFVLILIINLITAILYFIWNLRHSDAKNKNLVIVTIIMILCPVVGPLFFLLAYVWYKVFMADPVDLDDVIFSKDRIKAAVRAQEDQERNIVSIEEAIEVTNYHDLRELMMNVVRGDIREYLAAVALALDSEDSETAHYAASVLQDALNDFRFEVDRRMKLVLDEETPHRREEAADLFEYMNQVLIQRVFNPLEQENFVKMMDELMELYYTNWPDYLTSAEYEGVSMRMLEVKDYEGCKKWCERAKAYFPNTLATYTCQLKLYFNSGERQAFFETVEALKQSPVVIDSETLELMRVFR